MTDSKLAFIIRLEPAIHDSPQKVSQFSSMTMNYS